MLLLLLDDSGLTGTEHERLNAHWEKVYEQRHLQTVSWFEPAPGISLALINGLGLGSDAAVLDVGGGASSLAGALLGDGYTDVTVADIPGVSMEWASAQPGMMLGVLAGSRPTSARTNLIVAMTSGTTAPSFTSWSGRLTVRATSRCCGGR